MNKSELTALVEHSAPFDSFICLNSPRRAGSPTGDNVEYGVRIKGSEHRLQLMAKVFSPSARNKDWQMKLGAGVSYHRCQPDLYGDESPLLDAGRASTRAFLKGEDYLSTGWEIVEIGCLQSRPFIDGSERQCIFAFGCANGDYFQVDNISIRSGFAEMENPEGYWDGSCIYMPGGSTVGESTQVPPEIAERMRREARAYEASEDAFRPHGAAEAGGVGAVMQAEKANARNCAEGN